MALKKHRFLRFTVNLWEVLSDLIHELVIFILSHECLHILM